ncbi:MAG: HAD family hydrolase [Prochlorothrix sp.]|nr:HAD hydrolase-like protein [Prochlorothrix sp.]
MLLNFDYDGVIANSLTALVGIAQQAQADLGLGRSPQVADFAQLESMTFPDLARRIEIPEAAIDRYLIAVFQLQRQLPPQPLFEEISPLLHSLADHAAMTVITSSQGTAVRDALAQYGLGEVFQLVLGGELGLTKAERIQQAQQELRAAGRTTGADRAVMIGDSASDIVQGKAARALTIGVTWGFQSRDRLEAAQPDWLCDRPQELQTLLQDLLQSTSI